MSPRSKAGWGPYEFTRPAYDQQRDTEITHSVWITCELRTTYQRGVYTLKVSSTPVLETDSHLQHAIWADWPSALTQSFEALLYSQLVKLSLMLDEAAADKKQQSATQ